MIFFLLINFKMPIVGILTFMSSILGLSETEKAGFLDILILMRISNLCSDELTVKNVL